VVSHFFLLKARGTSIFLFKISPFKQCFVGILPLVGPSKKQALVVASDFEMALVAKSKRNGPFINLIAETYCSELSI